MSATLLSSFFVFILSGIYSLFVADQSGSWIHTLSGNGSWGVRLATFMSALYFYYYAALAEIHDGTSAALRKAPPKTIAHAEWPIRVFNQSLMLLLWVVFTAKDAIYFEIYFLILYLSFVIWDIVTWRVLRNAVKTILTIFDVAGFVVGVVGLSYFFVHRLGPASDIQWALGAVSTAYTVLAAVGVLLGFFILQFNPFAFEHYGNEKRR